MSDERYVFVWAGTYRALAAELTQMVGKIWGEDARYFIAAVTPVIDCAMLDRGVGSIARVYLGLRTQDVLYGLPWSENTEYPGRSL